VNIFERELLIARAAPRLRKGCLRTSEVLPPHSPSTEPVGQGTWRTAYTAVRSATLPFARLGCEAARVGIRSQAPSPPGRVPRRGVRSAGAARHPRRAVLEAGGCAGPSAAPAT
jgi:hypothetical protein